MAATDIGCLSFRLVQLVPKKSVRWRNLTVRHARELRSRMFLSRPSCSPLHPCIPLQPSDGIPSDCRWRRSYHSLLAHLSCVRCCNCSRNTSTTFRPAAVIATRASCRAHNTTPTSSRSHHRSAALVARLSCRRMLPREGDWPALCPAHGEKGWTRCLHALSS